MKSLTTSIYTFEDLIDDNFLYVDKTEYIYPLIHKKGQYFLSRPRRFGKSLLISTLKAIFQGKKELFQELALYNKPYDWKTYPVIHLDLGSKQVQSLTELKSYLTNRINAAADILQVKLSTDAYDDRFQELIEKLGAVDKVVILIDEYDKPLLDNISGDHLSGIRKILEGFYSVIKSTEAHQRFVLLTGVSKFSKVSVFSKLNNLTDLTMDAKFATALGYTQEELENNFSEYIDRVVKTRKIGRSELLEQVREWYNGYKFEEDAETVYNPVSTGKFFESGGKFHNYWFATGTPSFLLKLAKEQQFDFEKAVNKPVSELAFEAYEIGNLKTLPLLFQTGYLTIKSTVTDDYDTFYQLDFPNREVESAFEAYLIDEFAGVNKEEVTVIVAKLSNLLKAGDIDAFMEGVQIFFTQIPYDIQLEYEKYYQTIFYVIFRLIGLRIKVEARTNKGRIDAVIKTEKYIYIFEFKLNGSAEDALKQINEKEYYRKYLDSGKIITLVGANFSVKERCVEKWVSVELNQ